MRKIRGALLAILVTLGLGLGISQASPASATGETWSCGAITQVSWGAAQMCYNVGSTGHEWKLATLDKVTDGYCVESRYKSADAGGAYRNTVPRSRSCTTGGWTTVNPTQYLCDGVRAYRDDGTYFTVALSPAC